MARIFNAYRMCSFKLSCTSFKMKIKLSYEFLDGMNSFQTGARFVNRKPFRDPLVSRQYHNILSHFFCLLRAFFGCLTEKDKFSFGKFCLLWGTVDGKKIILIFISSNCKWRIIFGSAEVVFWINFEKTEKAHYICWTVCYFY